MLSTIFNKSPELLLYVRKAVPLLRIHNKNEFSELVKKIHAKQAAPEMSVTILMQIPHHMTMHVQSTRNGFSNSVLSNILSKLQP
jgi:hypothetical protein